jgi:uncharacterized protein (UPF0147 family)
MTTNEKVGRVLMLLRKMTYDERIPVKVREEYMDEFNSIVEGEAK